MLHTTKSELRSLSVKIRRAVRGNLRKALRLLGSDGQNWIQGRNADGERRFCARGAIEEANGHAEYAATEAFIAVLPRRVDGYIPAYNDAPRRKFADIKKKFEEAIELMK